jgi:hypothetical protein
MCVDLSYHDISMLSYILARLSQISMLGTDFVQIYLKILIVLTASIAYAIVLANIIACYTSNI